MNPLIGDCGTILGTHRMSDVVAPELAVEAARVGAVVDCGDGNGDCDERGTVGADLLRSLCREGRDEVDERSLHLRNALITGDLTSAR